MSLQTPHESATRHDPPFGAAARSSLRTRTAVLGATCLLVGGLHLVGASPFVSSVAAATIQSTPAGGPWGTASTWIGGVVPVSADDVVLDGPVTVTGTSGACATLVVTSAGTLSNGATTPATLEVTGSAINQGTIEDGIQVFHLRVGGDLTNEGDWLNATTTFVGTQDQALTQSGTALFESHLQADVTATGTLFVNSPFALLGDFDQEGRDVVLAPDCPITLRAGVLSGNLDCQGNEIQFETWSYMKNATLDSAVLRGFAGVTSLVTFTTSVTVLDRMANVRTFGPGHANVDGDLINYGIIEFDDYSFTVDVTGDLECYGVVRNSHITFSGPGDHHLTMGPDGDIGTLLFLPEFQTVTLFVDTDARITDGISTGLGSVVVAPGSEVFLDGGVIVGTSLVMPGSTLRVEGLFGRIDVDSAQVPVLEGTIQIVGPTTFVDDIEIHGSFENYNFGVAEVTFLGNVTNHGHFMNGDQPVVVHAHGNLYNRGVWDNDAVRIEGSEAQTVEIGAGIDVPEFVLAAGFSSSAYQWFKDDTPVLGQTTDEFLLITVGADDVGTYRCEGGEGQSREIVIQVSDVAGVPGETGSGDGVGPNDGAGDGSGEGSVVPGNGGSTGLVALSSARPNPIRRHDVFAGAVASFELRLTSPQHVDAAVFDARGREVGQLVSGELSAGTHVLEWDPSGTPSGVYFVKAWAGGSEPLHSRIVVVP
ncbi:MAG: hypothetical protein KDA27_11865 [Candidatus Eisenbacteria bacterium]|uniref:T9SS type A sorting domain-containing protein n=1 Tax=Eiseniibacteriota bacterium TaxID=2212470 RepID=A0A956NC38_UNCEI|nr:hypothetical protein [Candidatus Eisenbacteria bacterium]